MSNRTLAARYARSVLEVSVAEADPREVDRELAAITDVVRGHAELWKVLTHPVLPAARKRAVLDAILARVGSGGVVRRLLGLLVERDRVALLPEIADVYTERLHDHLRLVRAEVVTAVPLRTDRVTALERRFSEALGRSVTMAARVDPSIIGGVVTRIGSLVYDGSVSRQLERIRERLKAHAV